MKIFLTGATGFVGQALVQALAHKHTILAMARSERSAEQLEQQGVRAVRTELGQVRPEALAEVEVIIHCAAFVEQWGSREQFWSANVAGTEQLLEVARQAGVRRFILISTEAVLFADQPMLRLDETMPYPTHTPFLYSETKREAEKRVLAANSPEFQTLALRPRLIWGPGDKTILPVLSEMVSKGKFVWLDGGQHQTSTTHIANLVQAVELSLSAGQGGQSYFIADHGVTTYRDFFTALLATQGLDPGSKSLPGAVARLLAHLTEAFWRLLRRPGEPPLTYFAAAMMSRPCSVETGKAQRELGYQPVISRAQGLAELAGALPDKLSDSP